MRTFTITKEHLDSNNNYIGKENLENFDGHLKSSGGLGLIKFAKNLFVKGLIIFKAGDSIKAGYSIEAGGSIEAKLEISCKLRIFAGICSWKIPTIDEMKIICGKLTSGTIAFGNLIETGLPKIESAPNMSGKTVKVEIDGVKYEAVIR